MPSLLRHAALLPLAASLPLAGSLLFGCTPEPDEPLVIEEFDYEDEELPDHFLEATVGGVGGASVVSIDNTPSDNPTTNEGANLGRVLFYDEHLSVNGTIACASCHQAEFGFSDDRRLSEGFEGGDTGRHSMGLTNARFYGPGMFFWDQRAETLEDQVLMPFQDPIEMGMTLDTLVAAVADQDFYPPLFDAAFGDSEVTSDRISQALAQFVRSLVSYASRYDEGRAQVSSVVADFPNFSDAENLGKRMFMNSPMQPDGVGCAVCHRGESMSAPTANNNGLEIDSEDDAGYGDVTGLAADMGTFKVPSLRNIAVRGRFMHDGRFDSLREVVDHYADSVELHPNLGVPLSRHTMDLDDEHREALVAFMETLTDEDMLQDPRFASPFE
jgi:cytochrome c peroxidase